MENMHLEPITKEILEMLAKYTFTPERNFEFMITSLSLEMENTLNFTEKPSTKNQFMINMVN